jgi:hypothetical protein
VASAESKRTPESSNTCDECNGNKVASEWAEPKLRLLRMALSLLRNGYFGLHGHPVGERRLVHTAELSFVAGRVAVEVANSRRRDRERKAQESHESWR